MKVKKSDLKFLKKYASISETSTVLGNKLKIKVKDNVATYIQKSKDATLITNTSCDTNESFEILINVGIFYDFISTLDEDQDLSITEEGFSIGEDKKYTFDISELDFFDVDELVSMIDKSKKDKSTTSFEFKEFEQLFSIYSFIGKDSLESVGIMKNKLLTTDRVQIAYRDCDFSLDKNYYISKLSASLLKDYNEPTTIYITENFYFYYIGNTVCIFEWMSYAIPDLFEEAPYSKFNQTDFVEINKKEIRSSLKRMSFFTYDNPAFRVFITINKDHLLIENRDYNKSYEKVPLIKSNDLLNDVTFIVNSNNLLNFINIIEDESIFLFVNPSKDNRNTIRIEDTKSKYKFVHLLLKEDV